MTGSHVSHHRDQPQLSEQGPYLRGSRKATGTSQAPLISATLGSNTFPFSYSFAILFLVKDTHGG